MNHINSEKFTKKIQIKFPITQCISTKNMRVLKCLIACIYMTSNGQQEQKFFIITTKVAIHKEVTTPYTY